MYSIIAIAFRSLMIISAAVVLGLSIGLAKHQKYEKVPAVTSFSSFIGAFGILVAALGLLALWIERIPRIVVYGADALASMFFVAAGIALTVALKGVSSCTSTDAIPWSERIDNPILNGGCYQDDEGTTRCSSGIDGTDVDWTPGRCQRARVDNAFEYVGFLFAILSLVITYLIHRRGGR